MSEISPEQVRALWKPEHKDSLLSILDLVGDKWSQRVLWALMKEPRRFTELLELIPGISRRMLTHTLRQLERDGLVVRRARANSHASFEYALTPLGQSFREPVLQLGYWIGKNRKTIEANRERYDQAHDV